MILSMVPLTNYQMKQRKRVFFVITHTASNDYRDEKEEYMRRAKSLFKDRYGIKEDRLLEIDSLMEILIRYINQENKDAQSLLESKTYQILPGMKESGRMLEIIMWHTGLS